MSEAIYSPAGDGDDVAADPLAAAQAARQRYDRLSAQILPGGSHQDEMTLPVDSPAFYDPPRLFGGAASITHGEVSFGGGQGF